MTIYSPIPAYTYKITCVPTCQFYYGYRERNIKLGRTPENDLWKHYFTNSKVIHSLIELYDLKNFEIEILDQSTDPEKLYWLEQEYIKNSWGNALLINQQYRIPNSGFGALRGKGTPESAAKGVKTRRARGTDIIGAQKAAKTVKERGIGKIIAQKRINTMREHGMYEKMVEKMVKTRKALNNYKSGAQTAAEKNALTWELTFYDNLPILVKNLAKFCRENKLNKANMCNIAKTGGTCKGWKCRKVIN